MREFHELVALGDELLVDLVDVRGERGGEGLRRRVLPALEAYGLAAVRLLLLVPLAKHDTVREHMLKQLIEGIGRALRVVAKVLPHARDEQVLLRHYDLDDALVERDEDVADPQPPLLDDRYFLIDRVAILVVREPVVLFQVAVFLWSTANGVEHTPPRERRGGWCTRCSVRRRAGVCVGVRACALSCGRVRPCACVCMRVCVFVCMAKTSVRSTHVKDLVSLCESFLLQGKLRRRSTVRSSLHQPPNRAIQLAYLSQHNVELVATLLRKAAFFTAAKRTDPRNLST